MSGHPQVSRRRFTGAFVQAGLAGSSLLPAPIRALAQQTQEKPLSREMVASEIRRRADECSGLRYLVVDYYRIRYKLAFPLPVDRLYVPSIPVPTIADYPWSIWLLWELEERVNALGWAAEWFGHGEFARIAARDLEALSLWPTYCQLQQPDLASAHAARLMWTAYSNWHWLKATLRDQIRMACRRHVEELLPRVRAHYAGLLSKQDILALPAPHLKLANIPLIGTAGAVLSASVANHPALPALSRQVSAVMGAILDRRADGHSEGVAYDGYILDFIADWMRAAQRDERKEILDHPRLRDYLDESYMLAAPGSGMEVAAIGDVEPKEMPFHYSAQAKLARLQPDETRAWYLGQGRLEWIRADGLGSLAALSKILGKVPGGKEPPSGALNAHYAVALRSGWEKRDLAVAISCSTSPMSHLQNDNGTVVIGTAKKWIISDPGYEQYMKDAERDFTLGPAAHNYPLINGVAQDRKRPRLLSLKPQEPGCYQAKLELADCYPPNSRIRSVTRTVWLAGRAGVLIADQISADAVRTVAYHWHGHPEAAWWIQDSWVLLHMPDVDLWFTSPQVRISQENILRLPGSRGHLTLLAEAAEPIQPVIWWAFAIGNAAPEFRLLEDGRVTQFLGMRFEV